MRTAGNGMTLYALTHWPTLLADAAEANAASSQQAFAGMLIALGILLIVIMIGASARSKMARREDGRLSPRERIEQIRSAHTRAQADSAPLAHHVERIQELAGLLDNKAERLEQLLAEADERIALLRALNHSGPEPVKAPPPEPADPLAMSIYDLADSGKSTVEIAQELDEQVGKVDLILALRGR